MPTTESSRVAVAFTYDKTAFLEYAAAARLFDRGRVLDYVTALIACVALFMAAAGYYVFGSNGLSHIALGFALYWFFIRFFALKLARLWKFGRDPLANTEQRFTFTEEELSIERGEKTIYSDSYERLRRVFLSKKGIFLDYGTGSVWIPKRVFVDADEAARVEAWITQRAPKAKRV